MRSRRESDVKRETGDVGVRRTHRPMHRFDDVTADTGSRKRHWRPSFNVQGRTKLFRQAKAFETGDATYQAAQLGVFFALVMPTKTPSCAALVGKCGGAIGRGPSNARHR